VLPNRPIQDVTTDPVNPLVGYAAVGGFDQNTPSTPGHVYMVTCTANCASFTWVNKSGNLPNIPVDSILANPLYPQQVFAGTDWGLYYTNDITAGTPTWYRFQTGMPNVMIWDMSIDRGFTTLAVFTRGRGAYAWPLPSGPFGGSPTPTVPAGTVTPSVVPPTATATSPASTATATGTAPAVTATSTAPAATSTPGSPTATPTACTLSFEDVPVTNTFYPFVRCLACQGIVSGYQCGGEGEPCNANEDPYFRPNNYVTRGQLAKIVSESAGFDEEVPPSQWTFTDVPYDSTFWVWVERLSNREVMSGYACGIDPNEPCDDQDRPYFRPGNGATRGQLTKIVSNAAGFADVIPPSQQTFTDVPPTNTFWVYVERLLANRPDVMGGYPCGGEGEPCDSENRPYFRPNNPLTRGQTSKIVSNTFFPDCNPPRP
jgi:hypothetical protein